ncbi:site-specific integrase [Paenibacillus spongiae]
MASPPFREISLPPLQAFYVLVHIISRPQHMGVFYLYGQAYNSCIGEVNKMAYFEKRGEKWYFTISLGRDPVTGKLKQLRRVGGKTKKEAQAAATALEHELAQGTFVKETEMTFGVFAQDWLQQHYKGVKIGTKRVREKEIKLLNIYFENAKLKDITKKAYQEALDDLMVRPREMKKETVNGYAYTTVSGVHGTARMIFSKAKEFDMIKIDPTEFAKVTRPQKTVEELESEDEIPKYLEKEELSLFLRTARDHGYDLDYTMFLMLAYSGMRVGEMVVLKWSDIDFDRGTVKITKTYYNPLNNAVKFTLVPPKTKSSKREIDLEPIVLDELIKHRAQQRIFRMAMRDRYFDEDFIFTMTGKHPGYPIFVKTVQNHMTRLLKLAELNTALTPHSLRHTHTSLLAEAGAGLEEIMERLGHKNDDITKSVYLHVTKDRKKEASRKFGQLMNNITS